MAITREWQSGAEVGIAAYELPIITGTVTSSTTQKKTGNYSFSAARGAGVNNYFTVPITATRQFRTGFHWNPMSPSTTNRLSMFLTTGSLVSIEEDNTNFYLMINGVEQDSAVENGGSNFFHLGIEVKIHSSAGWAVVYKDGTEIMRFEGNTGNIDITSIRYHGASGAVGYSAQYIDNVYIDNTAGESAPSPLPIKTFPYVVEDGNGNYTGNWTGSDGNGVDNYALIDEIPADSADYIEENVADSLESFTMTNYTLAADEGVIAIIPQAICFVTGGSEQIALGTRYDSLDAVGSDQSPSGSYFTVWERQINKPDGNPWNSDQTAINGFEVIVKSRGTFS